MQKAEIIDENNNKIPVMFNPSELNSNISVSTTGVGANINFQRVDDDDFSVSLFFDTYEQGTDVREYTKKLEKLTEPTIGTGERRRPPVCKFSWGSVWFTGMVIKLSQKFTMFLSSGVPVRAQVSVTFKSWLSEKEDLVAQGSVNCRRMWTVEPSDRLYLIAHKALGSSSLWKLIADENNIYDPLNFPGDEYLGKTIIIPDIHGPNSYKKLGLES